MAAVAAEYEKFCTGWLRNRKESCAALRAKHWCIGSVQPDVPTVAAQVVCEVLKVAREALEPVLPPGPMFVLTDYRTAATDAEKGSFGLTVWGATFVSAPVRTPRDWWYKETCPVANKQTRISMYLYAKYCNCDWVFAPVIAFFLRELLPWPSPAEANAAVGVAEFPIYPSLPIYQFADASGERQYMRSKNSEVFNCIRLGTSTLVDVVQGFQVADPQATHHALTPVDVELSLFLLYRNAKNRRLVEVFDRAMDVCQKGVAKLLYALPASLHAPSCASAAVPSLV